jgi:rare lipoprotein A
MVMLTLAGCDRSIRERSLPAAHYVLGDAYEVQGIWYYPRRNYRTEQTGLATVYGDGHAPLTTDGERFDQAALAAAHRTLPLPAIARVTDLETGRQVVVRINDRGPSNPGRLIAVTRRTAALLGFPRDGVARVRLEVLGGETRAAVEAAGGDSDARLAIATAPVGAVIATELPAPPGVRTAPVRRPATLPSPPDRAPAANAPPPLRLPEWVSETAPQPGTLWIELDEFGHFNDARRQAARVRRLAPVTERAQTGRETSYRVRIGPVSSVAAADQALTDVIGAGITDARIVVE